MKLYRILFAFLAVFTTSTLLLAAQTKDFSQHIVWRDAEQLSAQFIPGAMLDGADLKNFPVSMEQLTPLLELERLKRNLRLQSNAAGNNCALYSETGLTSWTGSSGSTFLNLLSSKVFVARGRVVSVISGWKTGFSPRVVTLVYLEIADILACNLGYLDNTRQVFRGDIIAVEMEIGSFEMNGTRFCNRTDAILEVPKLGDEVVATGIPQANDSFYAGPGEIFRVHLGEILPQPYRDLKEREPLSIQDAATSLRGSQASLEGCEGLAQ